MREQTEPPCARKVEARLASQGGRKRREREQMTGTARGKKSGKAAAIDVLRKSGEAMPVKEVVAAALADPQVTGLQGRTPAATLSAALYTEAKKPDGPSSWPDGGWSRRIRSTRRPLVPPSAGRAQRTQLAVCPRSQLLKPNR
jgi:HB1, ASXL, restriction endonuclease HTH domain